MLWRSPWNEGAQSFVDAADILLTVGAPVSEMSNSRAPRFMTCLTADIRSLCICRQIYIYIPMSVFLVSKTTIYYA